MNKLTLVVSNRNRFNANKPTEFWLKSLLHQSNNNFDIIIVDGGSKNYLEIKEYFTNHNIKVIQHILGEKFNRSLLNNVGIRNAKTEYIMTSDADMFYAKDFFGEIISLLDPNTFIESRTMYWKNKITSKIYGGELDPFNNIDSCKIGRIKQRTTAGGAQCGNINLWNKVKAFNEFMDGWGSEDVELLKRVERNRYNIKWIGETIEDIKLFHQHHDKPNLKEDLESQERNKVILNSNILEINKDGWGGIYGEKI